VSQEPERSGEQTRLLRVLYRSKDVWSTAMAQLRGWPDTVLIRISLVAQ
jgi:hypothetical protein